MAVKERRKKLGSFFFNVATYIATAYLVGAVLKPEAIDMDVLFRGCILVGALLVSGWFTTPKL